MKPAHKNTRLSTMKIISPISLFFFIFTLTLFTGCEKDKPESGTVTITVNTDVTYQTIAGFGGGNRMWGTEYLKPEEAKKAFGTDDTDLGLSIFRVRIASDSTEWPLILESVQEAQKYGVKIMASPWSPPHDLKSNNSDVGGYLLPENYGAFKDYINAFVACMAANGVDIYTISIQNEPDVQVTYESCDWTSTQMLNFLKDYGDQIEGTLVSAPESYNFNKEYTGVLLNDTGAAENLDIVAGHIYGGGLEDYPLPAQMGKEIWMSEFLMNLSTGNSGMPAWTSYDESEIWEETLDMLHTIYGAMMYNWNAYVWWYLQRYYSFIGDGEEGTTFGEVLKRGYAFSHFSKYIRPGFVRVATDFSASTDLKICAFEGDDQIVVVIINLDSFSVNAVTVEVPSVTSVSAHETSVDLNRKEKSVNLTDGKVVLDISPKSIVTVVVEE